MHCRNSHLIGFGRSLWLSLRALGRDRLRWNLRPEQRPMMTPEFYIVELTVPLFLADTKEVG